MSAELQARIDHLESALTNAVGDSAAHAAEVQRLRHALDYIAGLEHTAEDAKDGLLDACEVARRVRSA